MKTCICSEFVFPTHLKLVFDSKTCCNGNRKLIIVKQAFLHPAIEGYSSPILRSQVIKYVLFKSYVKFRLKWKYVYSIR